MNAPDKALDQTAFKSELTTLIPHLRAFARNMCHDDVTADDLAQEALLKAWKARESYIPGTNLRAWTFTILRNHFYSVQRRAWRSQPLEQEVAENTLSSTEDQTATVKLLELRNALNILPEDQRDALVLVGAAGLSYEEAAEICDCAVGTIKSRVSRARQEIERLLNDGEVGFNSDDDENAYEAFASILEEADELVENHEQS